MNSAINRFKTYMNAIMPYGHVTAHSYDYKDKDENINDIVSYMLNKTQKMFKWKGLPDTINARILELYLQCNGNVCFYKHENNLYVFTGALGGTPNVYYMPTIYTIANPALNLSVNAVINEDCIVMPNDSMYMGLLPLFKKYATLQVETEISMFLTLINTRIFSIISAKDESTRKSAMKYLEDIINGDLGIITENAFLEGLKTSEFSQKSGSNILSTLVDTYQFLQSNWCNEIGIDMKINLQRPSMSEQQIDVSNVSLMPLVDDMLEMRRTWAEKVNEMFGTEITVDLASAWAVIHNRETHSDTAQPAEEQYTAQDAPEQEDEPEISQDAPEQEDEPEISQDAQEQEAETESGEAAEAEMPQEAPEQEDEAEDSENAEDVTYEEVKEAVAEALEGAAEELREGEDDEEIQDTE